jgi:hypothetical protein
MAKLYISYSKPDAQIAKRIAEGLRHFGHDITLDVDTLSPGQEWRKVLTDALQSSEVFVSLLTSNSIQSSFVLTELGAARAFSQTSKKTLVIPIVFRDVQVPPVIQDIQYISAAGDDTDEIVLQIESAITAFIGKRAAEEKKQVEEQRRIESTAAEYVEEAIKSLREHEGRNRRIGSLWYYLGYFTLIVGVLYGAYSITKFSSSNDTYWIPFAYLSLKSIVIVGLLIASSKYAFTLGKSYMSEALKSADRVHAISLGKFYLQAFGDRANWEELKEVFQHWNIDKSSAFSSLDTNNFDPKFLEAVLEVAKVVTSKK